MSEARLRSLMLSGITALKTGELNSARNYFERALYTARDHDLLADLWFYMSEIESDEAKKRNALDEALSYRMTHARARRSLAILNGTLKVGEIVDSNTIIAPTASERETNADRFECPSCAGIMSFSPDGETLICDFCTTKDKTESNHSENQEQDFFSTMATLRGHSKPISRKVFHCEGCSAEFILAPDAISESCAYCASPHIVNHGETRDLLNPDAIILHKFNQRHAAQLLIKWVKENNFTPQGRVLQPRGVYIPVWTFDIGGSISYSGERLTEEKNRDVYGFGLKAEKTYITERGNSTIFVDDLIIPAAKKHERFLHSLIKNYRLSETKAYDPRYLSNWAAETYEIELSTAALEARSRAYKNEKKKLKRSLYQLRNFRSSSANMAITSYKLLLLPVWMTTYPYEDKDYLVLINGQNGEIEGELPDALKPKKKKSSVLGWLDEVI